MKILLKRRNPLAIIHPKKYKDDVGVDLVYIGPNRIIWPFQMADLDTGWDIKIPDGFWGQIKSRSSTFFKKRLLVLEGVIDPGYTGKLSVATMNPTPWPRRIKHKDRLGQLLIHKALYNHIQFVDEGHSLPQTERGRKGFGSTDGNN